MLQWVAGCGSNEVFLWGKPHPDLKGSIRRPHIKSALGSKYNGNVLPSRKSNLRNIIDSTKKSRVLFLSDLRDSTLFLGFKVMVAPLSKTNKYGLTENVEMIAPEKFNKRVKSLLN